MATSSEALRARPATATCTRGITVAIGGTAYSATIAPGRTVAQLLADLKVKHGVEMDGLQLHTRDGMVLELGDDLWSIVADGETLFAFPASANSKHTNPAAARCPGCWDQ